REVSPLRQADDALVVDTSDLDISQVLDRVLNMVRSVAREGSLFRGH
ncbi:MAG: hypothetical protein C0614_10670, partial [Desulfuromonas sp.]